jgi:hypothetical protein
MDGPEHALIAASLSIAPAEAEVGQLVVLEDAVLAGDEPSEQRIGF